MKRADAVAIGTMGIPSDVLMENAGQAVVREIVQRIKNIRGTSFVLLCGKGNNGGDGFVVARLLRALNASVTVVRLSAVKEFSDDARAMYGKLQNIPVLSFQQLLKSNPSPAVIIDAMFGTSFHGKVQGRYRSAVVWSNQQPAKKIAIDIPTGLDGDTGEAVGDVFTADMTITLSNPKIGFYSGRAKEFTGEVVIADIGIPKEAVERNSENIFLTEKEDIQQLFPHRPSNSHKHSVGKIFIIAGSKGMTGAALLASGSAMRSGAGQVILGIPETEYPVVAKRTLEVMPFSLAATSAGTLAGNALNDVEKKISWASVVAIGCGLSLDPETQKTIRSVIQRTAKAMVIDADALSAIAGDRSILKKRKSPSTVLTPHLGEFSRLIGRDASEIEKNKFSYARSFATENSVTLVLKGAPTIIASANGSIFVNPTGNPGMSTAGSGDVLSGMIAALLGQGLSADAAAVAGVYLHGAAGDLASRKVGIHSMIASDIIKFIPNAIRMIPR